MIGPSLYFHPPSVIIYDDTLDHDLSSYDPNRECWLAFRCGVYTMSQTPLDEFNFNGNGFNTESFGDYGSAISWTFQAVRVTYSKDKCEQYKDTAKADDLIGREHLNSGNGVGDCVQSRDVLCTGENPLPGYECRLSIRMFAAFTLLGCLLVKATYMISVNFRARREKKSHFLT